MRRLCRWYICNDVSENRNRHKIGLGHGVPDIILQMPQCCGPGKYAMAKSMNPARLQGKRLLLRHLQTSGHEPVVYGLTFGYVFTRVLRSNNDDTQRIDLSNRKS